ncbi:unnamed protein product [Notodromas monacha]|uniref:Leucine-rich repeat-containing protein 20 n=1 Tax=Notodromas monacha TaxID=399045 RepID=A0A7R9GCW9_9CRUS|nr:unnamed protein product [Notodromas monacha]CAG0918098.1 unnamed protein product [Notodromas monacha]
MGDGVVRVIERSRIAEETGILDLSDCQLMQVPDAIYHLMRNLRLIQVNLARNVIAKLPPKFPLKFSLITKLDMSQNKIRTLPDEFMECSELTTLDVSHNCFTYLPSCIFKLPSLRRLKANNNYITDIDTERLARKPLLVEIDLRENPISSTSRRALEAASAPERICRLPIAFWISQ